MEFLISAVKEVMETMAFMEMTPGDPKEPHGFSLVGDVVSTIGFTGMESGIFLTSVRMELARKITANLLGIEEEELTDNTEISDAMGELTNMIAGNVKNLWAGEGLKMDLSVPMVMAGKDMEARFRQSLVEGAAVDFTDDEGRVLRVEFRLGESLPEDRKGPR